MKALFFRKCANSKEYDKLSNIHPELGQELNFKIVKIVKFMTYDEYINFTSNFLVDDLSIKLITKELYMDEFDTVYCALFTWKNEEGFLVYPSGYNYARYVARWNCKMGYGD